MISFSIFLCLNKNARYHNPLATRTTSALPQFGTTCDCSATTLSEQLNILASCFCWNYCKSAVFVVLFLNCVSLRFTHVSVMNVSVCNNHPTFQTNSQDIASSAVKLLAWRPGDGQDALRRKVVVDITCVFVIFRPCCKRYHVTFWSIWWISFSIFLLPQQKHTLPQLFGDENYVCIAAVRNDMRLLGLHKSYAASGMERNVCVSSASASPFKKRYPPDAGLLPPSNQVSGWRDKSYSFCLPEYLACPFKKRYPPDAGLLPPSNQVSGWRDKSYSFCLPEYLAVWPAQLVWVPSINLFKDCIFIFWTHWIYQAVFFLYFSHFGTLMHFFLFGL